LVYCSTKPKKTNQREQKQKMRLTPELINISPQFMNPLKEREIDLRGNKIALIENLGVTKVKKNFFYKFF